MRNEASRLWPRSCATFVGILGLVGFGSCAEYFHYKLTIELSARTGSSAAEVELFLAEQKRSGMSEEFVKLNRPKLLKAFEEMRKHQRFESELTIAVDGKKSYVLKLIPSYNSGHKMMPSRQLFDGTNTYLDEGKNSHFKVLPGDQRDLMSRSLDELLLTGMSSHEPVTVSSEMAKHGQEAFSTRNSNVEVVKTSTSKDGVVEKLLTYVRPHLRPFVSSRYRILKWQPIKASKVASELEVTRLRGDGSVASKESYTLVGAKSEPMMAPDRFIPLESDVIDLRLGSDRQVTFRFKGELPSLNVLRAKQESPNGGSGPGVFVQALLYSGIGLISLSIVSLLIRRSQKGVDL